MSLLIFFIVSYVVLSVALYFIFQKAGVESWKGLVPVLNFMEWCKLVGRPTWWTALLFVPIVGFFIFVGLAVDMVRSFGKYKLSHSFLAGVAAPLYFLYLGTNKTDKYIGKTRELEEAYKEKMEIAAERGKERELRKLEEKNPYKKSTGREWVEAIVFAVFAAAFIRMFLIEAYVIPTPSMEGSLLVGDFLFVSKAHYGIRTPKTVAMLPLIHNRIPQTNVPSYFTKPNLEFRRLPALETIDRNDLVVFNYPEGDSVYFFPERTWSVSDYRRGAVAYDSHKRKIESGKAKLTYRPIDKKDHYIKRCVAVAGDSIQIINRELYINGARAEDPKNIQFLYYLNYPADFDIRPSLKRMEEWGIENNASVGDVSVDRSTGRVVALILSNEQKEKVESIDPNISIQPVIYDKNIDSPAQIFPHDPKNYQWTRDEYGPLWIPKAGATVELNEKTLPLYRRVISNYEGNELEVKNGQIFINGEATNEYTFKMNYYWMMGDNRHNSEDSRIWGFVPEDHVVGKPLFIWMSANQGNLLNGIRFNRMFKAASKM